MPQKISDTDIITLTEDELAVIMLSLMKHYWLIRAGTLPELINFASDNFDCLISKIDKMQRIAWLREQKAVI
ncbi:MAG: hypothetical protein MUO73_05625 [Thermoplasmata archaeon]|nr:hypothetical protein [Thermoplasmata archaeon]